MTKGLLVGMVLAALGASSAVALPVEEIAALDPLPGADIPVQLHFDQRKLSEVLEAIAAAAPFRVTFQDDVGDRIVTANWEKQSLKQVLVRLAQDYDLAYSVSGKAHLVVSTRVRD